MGSLVRAVSGSPAWRGSFGVGSADRIPFRPPALVAQTLVSAASPLVSTLFAWSAPARDTTLLPRHQYTRGIKCLPDHSVLHNLESCRFDQLRDALFHLAAPKCRGHLAQDFIYRIERRRVLPDQYQRQVAAIAQDPAELAQRAHNIRSEEHTSELQSPCNLV